MDELSQKTVLDWGDVLLTIQIPKGKRIIIVSPERLSEILKREQWNGHLPDSVNVEELVRVIADGI